MGKKKDKDKKKKEKKDKKKKDKSKKKEKSKKKKASSSSSGDSSEGSNSSESAPVAKKQKKEKVEKEVAEEAPIIPVEAPKINLDNLLPVEDGIQRFIFYESEAGPLGLRFSGGFPPLVLAVVPDSFAAKKKIPINFSVHAINGHPMLPKNHELVMSGLKTRPVALDVRPQGWKPKEMVKELERRREREVAEKQLITQIEEQRRREVALENAERKQREEAERAVREEEERKETAVFAARAREKVAEMRARRQEFEKVIQEDADDFRAAAEELMQASYGSNIKIEGRRGVPLRLFTRRKDVAWNWYGELQELIGGGAQGEPGDTFN